MDILVVVLLVSLHGALAGLVAWLRRWKVDLEISFQDAVADEIRRQDDRIQKRLMRMGDKETGGQTEDNGYPRIGQPVYRRF